MDAATKITLRSWHTVRIAETNPAIDNIFQPAENMRRAIEDICEAHGVDIYHPGAYLHLLNEPWMQLCIGNHGNTISVSHVGVQNGDSMYDPDIIFWVSPETRAWYPIEYRNDYLGIRDEYAEITQDGLVVHKTRRAQSRQQGTVSFTRTWAANLRHQGFIEKAQRQNED